MTTREELPEAWVGLLKQTIAAVYEPRPKGTPMTGREPIMSQPINLTQLRYRAERNMELNDTHVLALIDAVEAAREIFSEDLTSPGAYRGGIERMGRLREALTRFDHRPPTR